MRYQASVRTPPRAAIFIVVLCPSQTARLVVVNIQLPNTLALHIRKPDPVTSRSQLRWYRMSRFVCQHARPALRAHCSPSQQSLPGRAPRHHWPCQLVISVSPLVCVKTRSNSFHSTLEPNTEVFSKVSRSLAQFTLVNSVSTLLNKGGNTCNCPNASQDFCVNQNKQASAQLLCSSLVLSRHERSEGRRNSCEAEKCTHSEQHAPLQGCREDISGVLCSSWPTQNMPTCQSHATNMPRFMPMFVQVKTPTNLKRQIEGKPKESIFSSVGANVSLSFALVG